MKVFKILVLTLSALFFFSCESEQEIIEEKQEQVHKKIKESSQSYQNRTSSYIRRGKIKERLTTGYRTTFYVDNNAEQIKNYALILKGSKGAIETVIKPSGKKNKKGLEIYNWDLDGDGIFEIGEEVKIIATPLNEEGKEISGAQVLRLIVKTNFTGRIKKRRIGSSFKLSANIINDKNNETASAEITINNLKGSITTINTDVKNNEIATVFESKGEDNIVFDVTFILKDKNGNFIYKKKRRIERNRAKYKESLRSTELRANPNNNSFTINVALNKKLLSDSDIKNLNISAKIKPINGGTPTKEKEGVDFGFLEISRGLVIYTNNDINFANSKRVVGKKYLVIISLNDVEGKKLASKKFKISATK